MKNTSIRKQFHTSNIEYSNTCKIDPQTDTEWTKIGEHKPEQSSNKFEIMRKSISLSLCEGVFCRVVLLLWSDISIVCQVFILYLT